MTKVDKVVEGLRKHGPLSALGLAKMLNLKRADVYETIRIIVRNQRYGVYIEAVKNNVALYNVDEDAYESYVKNKGKVRSNLPTIKLPKTIFNRDFPRPITKFQTAWQESSPYWVKVSK